ncbi:MAG: HAD family hydrolase [Ruminococcus sp.]|nr:HAD family hydrolase [Ruminococcus sp.]
MLNAICSKKELSLCRYYSCISDIINAPEVLRLKEITHHISTTRFQHCLNVSYHGYLICRCLRLDARSAARAGPLHDLFYYDRHEYNSCRKKNQPSHSRRHSDIALINARKLTDVNPKEYDMIVKHMWPVTAAFPKYTETYIITLVDKYCAVLEFCLPKFRKIIRKTGG